MDVLITHKPPVMILDESNGTHLGNAFLRKRVLETKPQYHLFGHAHEAYGTKKHDDIVFSNASILDDFYRLKYKPQTFII